VGSYESGKLRREKLRNTCPKTWRQDCGKLRYWIVHPSGVQHHAVRLKNKMFQPKRPYMATALRTSYPTEWVDYWLQNRGSLLDNGVHFYLRHYFKTCYVSSQSPTQTVPKINCQEHEFN
jgi:hypothetical protein